jgi:hypothetical protein
VTSAVSIVLGLVFGWAGIGKAVRAKRWRANIRAYGLPRFARAAGFLLLPWVELIAAVALLAGRPAIGATIVGSLIVLFCVAIINARIVLRNDKLGCTCFGGTSVYDYRILLLRNGTLAVLAGYLLAVRPLAETRGPGLPGAGPVMFVTLVLAGGVAAMMWLGTQLILIRRKASLSPIRKAAAPRPAS